MARSLRRHRGVTLLVLIAVALPLRATLASSGGDFSGRVIGGDPVAADRYPFMTSLQTVGATGRSAHFCGGALVDERWVLTAAHCLEGRTVKEFRLVVGASRLSAADGQVRRPIEIRIAPAYDGDATHGADVALVRLSTPVGDIAPVELVRPSERDRWEPGDRATVVGWGVTTESGASPSDQLSAARVPIQPDTVMAAPDAYGASFRPSDMLGAGPATGGADACFGDSGGPLLIGRARTLRQIGVVSFGRGCARPGYPGVYARLGEGPIRRFIDSLVPPHR